MTGPRPAFTLIEVTAVLVLTAVLAGVAAVSLSGPRHRAAVADAVDQLAFADAQVRGGAVSADEPRVLLIDLATGRLSRTAADGAAVVTLAELPAGVSVSRVMAGSDVIDAGRARVPISAEGRSRSYAVGLSTAAGPRWLVVAGLSGQVTAVADETTAESALEPTRADGP